MPSRRKDNSSPKAIARKIKKGQGVGAGGTGIDYLPWFFVTDVSSWGTSCVMTGWNGQEHHWLSFGERKTCYCYAWRPDRVVQILGQFPIFPREETVRIAQMMRIKHPPGVITVDFMLKIRLPNGETYYVARDVKQMKELADRSVLEALSITLVAMELRGIDWGLIVSDAQDFPEAEWENVDWAFKSQELKVALALQPDTVWQIAKKLTADIRAEKYPVILRDVCSGSDRAFGLASGTSMKVARFLVANKAWSFNMSQLICTSKPMSICTERFESVMEQLWVRLRSA